MIKKAVTGMVSVVITVLISSGMTALAGEWRMQEGKWRYENTDGTRMHDGWQWIDGNGDGVAECYYFDGSGYLLVSATTPDGYTVNQDGAWVSGGVVQVKNVAGAPVMTEVKLEDVPDKEGFLARLEIISNGADVDGTNVREYNSADPAQDVYALDWVIDPSDGIMPWNCDESLSFGKGEEFEVGAWPNDPMMDAVFKEYPYYHVFSENSVHWVLRYILNREPAYEEGLLNNWIFHRDGKYYIAWIDVGYMKPPIIVSSIYSDGMNYYVTFDWQRIWPWDNAEPVYRQYAILRRNQSDIGLIWSIVQTSASPIFKVP